MVIIKETLEEIRNYIRNSERADEQRKEEALYALSLLECSQVAENTELKGVVGFNENDMPLFWNMNEGNLLGTCKTGVGINYMGCTTVLLSLILRFTKEQFQYYLFTDDFAPDYLKNNEHCADSITTMFEDEKDYCKAFEKLFNELKYRETLSETELNAKPFLLVVFGNSCRLCGDRKIKRMRALFNLLFRKGKSLRVACMVMTTRFELEFLYHRYKKTFSAFVIGKTYLKTAKKLLRKDVPKWLVGKYWENTNMFLYQNGTKREDIKTYHISLGMCLRQPYQT